MAVVLVTGASGGIGAAIARAFAVDGHRLALGCRQNVEEAEALAQELQDQGTQAIVCPADLRDEGVVDALFDRIEATLGPVGILVNNAGTATQSQVQDITLVEWNDMQAIHSTAAFLCARRALPAMLRAHQGVIVNVASVWGLFGASCESHYSAAKAAVIGFTKALAKEVGPGGVRANCVAPGVIQTPMLNGFTPADLGAIREETPLGRLGLPEDVAAAVRFLASDDATFITGQTLTVDGGWTL